METVNCKEVEFFEDDTNSEKQHKPNIKRTKIIKIKIKTFH